MSPLDRKLFRDLWRLRTQGIAIALVIAAGIAVHLTMAGMLASLTETRSAYYERQRFADLWASVVRAPNTLGDNIRAIEGVGAAETRIAAPVLFDMDSMAEPPTGVIYSLPRGRPEAVNAIYLDRGRLPDPSRRDETVILKGFAQAHGLEIGDAVRATIRGKREQLVITGFALSPEYVYAIAPGQLIPDPALFGVLWMDRDALENAADMEGAFNETVVRLNRSADPDAVADALDQLLEPYGAPGAITRRDHVSAAFVESEVEQLQTMGAFMPPIFLAVAAFLVNIVISRLVAVEREQIGLMKAFGYGSGEVAWHYLKLAGGIGLVGLLLGMAAGTWLGRAMAVLYTQYYEFPYLVFAATPGVYLIGVAVTVLSVGAGAFWSVTRAARLAPAVAMRAPPPPDYSVSLGATVTRLSVLDQQTRMILRQLIRYPIRNGMTTLGVAAAGSLLVVALYFTDAMEEMIATYFDISNRHDIAVVFTEARPMSAFYDLARREGVIEAEPFRSAAARLQFEQREVRMGLTGVIDRPGLSRLIDDARQTINPPPGGLVLSQDLANRLGAQAGDTIRAEVTEGARPVLELTIASTPTVLLGSGVHMRLEDLSAALGEDRVVSGAYLRVDENAREALYLELKEAPLVAGVQLHELARDNMQEILDQSMGVSVAIYTLFAGLIAIGVIYNAVRVSLAERARELASLRVLGFSKTDVSYILLGETGFILLIAIPLGLAAGTAMAWALAGAMSSDFFRLPYIIYPSTYAFAAAVLIVIGAISALVVRRRIDTLDLVAVLKTRE
ncbi:MAG: ABC transporter permease [Pseudomonadota bacterium]